MVGINLSFKSDRLKTRKLSDNDVSTLFAIYSDHEAMQYRGSQPIQTLEDALDMVTKAQIINSSGSKLRFGICKKSNHQLIGTLLLILDSKSKQCEIGFSFGKAHWNNGYGQETLKMVEQNLSTMENIETLKAWCIQENRASINIFEKAGFSLVKQNQYPQSNLYLKKIRT